MEFYEKTLSSETVYRGKIVKVRVDEVELIDGRHTKREVCDHQGGVAVLPITDAGEVILVRQFRYPYMQELLEVPAGKLEPGEDPLACGVRELKEETGFTAREITPMGVIYPSPGYVNERLHIFVARGLTSGETHLDEGEFLSAVKLTLEEALEMVEENRIHDAKTVIALLRAARMSGR